MNTGIALRFVFQSRNVINRSDTSAFRQVGPGLILVLIGERDAETKESMPNRVIITADYVADQELANGVLASLTLPRIDTPTPSLTPTPMQRLDVQIITVDTLPGRAILRLRVYNGRYTPASIDSQSVWLAYGYAEQPAGPRVPAEMKPFVLLPGQAVDLTLTFAWHGEPFATLGVLENYRFAIRFRQAPYQRIHEAGGSRVTWPADKHRLPSRADPDGNRREGESENPGGCPADTRAASQALAVVDKVLELVYPEAQYAERTVFDIVPLLEKVCRDIQSVQVASIRDVMCDIPGDLPPIRANRGAILRITKNLLATMQQVARREIITLSARQGDHVVVVSIQQGENGEAGLPIDLGAFVQAPEASALSVDFLIARRLVESNGGKF